MYKTTILTLTLAAIVILPATAQLGRVWTDFQSYSVDLQNYLKTSLGESLKPVDAQAETAIYNATGELNIPNPITAGQRFRDQDKILIDSLSDKFENNSTVRSALVSNEINRLISRGAIEGTLGVKGQIRLKTKLINTEKTLENIATLSNDADKNSQELLSNIASAAGSSGLSLFTSQLSQLLNANQVQTIKIQQEQSKIIAESFLQNLQTNQSLQYSNLNLANISQQMDEANRARRVDTAAEGARLLRTTAQIDLFGRETEN
ncbi:hypothetical protein [Fortiea contorta]|uniref:hypothetical protein n=1 Tax=Fortiea contorta TaxID=1892405 RepID=UPI000349439B|nr:hypothetical protein [Fortiea contorta]